jgi:dihydroorotase-like cyclic amidohydrolase
MVRSPVARRRFVSARRSSASGSTWPAAMLMSCHRTTAATPWNRSWPALTTSGRRRWVARVFSLYPRKGVFQVGSDADLAFYDPHASWEVRGADMLHRNKWTPFEGKTIGASVVRTMLRGVTVFNRAQAQPLAGSPGDGRFLPRGYGASAADA